MADFKRVTLHIVDEFGVESDRLLGDNIFIGAPVMIAPEHHEIHCGDSYTAQFISAAISTNNTQNALIVVPDEPSGADQKLYHMSMLITSGGQSAVGEGVVRVYEGYTGTLTPGTALAQINRDRNSLNATDLTIQVNVAGITGTTLVYSARTGASRTSAAARGDEFILKNNTSYYVLWTSGSNNTIVDFEFNHYIHPGI